MKGQWRARWPWAGRESLGWRDPHFLAGRPALDRALRLLAMLLILQRASYVMPGVVSLFHDGLDDYRSGVMNVALLAVAIGWNTGLAVSVRRGGWFGTGTVVADAAVVSALMVLGAVNVDPANAVGPLNWPSRFALASAALIGAALPPLRALVVALLPLTAAFVAPTIATGTVPGFAAAVGNLNSFLWFAVILYFMRRYLTGQGRALDDMAAARLAAEAQRARFQTRIENYRALHDTALSTLTAIARGGLDHRTEAVRQRCARDAELVRTLIQEDLRFAYTDLGDRLREVLDDAAGLGLRVRFQHDRLPTDLPASVIDAVAGSAGEALNNVAKHSGADLAWLTAWSEDDMLIVRVVDQGVGFDPGRTPRGFGVRWSIDARMAEIGGELELTSAPGEGTCVELRWPLPGRVA